jgi:Fe-S oxidoreductase
MCGKCAIVTGVHDRKNEKDQQQNNSTSSTALIEQIDETCYTFDTEHCALMFKKFIDIYGSSFADE